MNGMLMLWRVMTERSVAKELQAENSPILEMMTDSQEVIHHVRET